MRKSFGVAILVALFLVTSGAWAGAITVVDSDFHLPNCPGINACTNMVGSGWTGDGNNSGVQTALSAYGSYPTTQFGLVNPSGYLQQVLSVNLAANTVYTLTLDVSEQPGDVQPFGAIVELLAGSTVLVQATAAAPNGNTIPVHKGDVVLWTLTYTSGASVTAGQALKIYLGSSTIQSDYTNVALDASPVNQGGVPEPAMFALVGAGLLGLVTRRRFAK